MLLEFRNDNRYKSSIPHFVLLSLSNSLASAGHDALTSTIQRKSIPCQLKFTFIIIFLYKLGMQNSIRSIIAPKTIFMFFFFDEFKFPTCSKSYLSRSFNASHNYVSVELHSTVIIFRDSVGTSLHQFKQSQVELHLSVVIFCNNHRMRLHKLSQRNNLV